MWDNECGESRMWKHDADVEQDPTMIESGDEREEEVVNGSSVCE